MFSPPGGSAPTPTGNPGSAPDNDDWTFTSMDTKIGSPTFYT